MYTLSTVYYMSIILSNVIIKLISPVPFYIFRKLFKRLKFCYVAYITFLLDSADLDLTTALQEIWGTREHVKQTTGIQPAKSRMWKL